MGNTVYDRLLRREIGQDRSRYAGVRGIYGDRQWVEDMDIVNELEGHNGCVNALSWSRSGRLLASGSDDHRINIYAYYPESSTSQFNLTTSIMTGHHSNIFSVKFMPYSNDRTIVSATDDVRIFDIEHSGHNIYGSTSSSSARRNIGVRGVQDGLTLTEGDTNAKAFKCHTDTVKRIVTEDNPFYFLTCSEDGDVRQWDVRQPSSHYPSGRVRGMPRWAHPSESSDHVPPPLISYSRYNLDLNTVSCSPSRPHYIALGGAHLHCFLHDRRMLGRDKFRERGTKLPSPGSWNDTDNNNFATATQCVKKFAPNGQQRMGRNDSGHITACKISDADPNELIVSWSGDWIYSFDIMRTPDASETTAKSQTRTGESSRRVKDKTRKRKRPKSGAMSGEAAARAGSRQRTESSHTSDPQDGLALRVNYGNGQSEEIRIEQPSDALSEGEAEALPNTQHYRIAQTTLKISKLMFIPDNPSTRRTKLASVMGFASAVLPDIDEISRSWLYPMDPTEVDVALQNELRARRCATRRFIQAAGTVARVLGGRLQTGGNSEAIVDTYFSKIQPAPSERPLQRKEQFVYDFLKAILLWLDSGLGALVEGFSSSSRSDRRPIPIDADVDAIDEILIPYLLDLATNDPIVNVDVSRFETDATRILYTSEKDAVLAFALALKTPFADLTGAVIPTSANTVEKHDIHDRSQVREKWALQVGRGLLFNIAKRIRFARIDRAFGGRGVANEGTKAEERALRDQQADIDPHEDDETVVDAAMVDSNGAEVDSDVEEMAIESLLENDGSDIEHWYAAVQDSEEEDEADEEDDDDDDGDVDPLLEGHDEEDSDEDVSSEGLSRTRSGRILWRSDFDRSYLRERVESHIPCAPHTRIYRGHCNVRTVKDVNFFGLQDEYVVSGSDSGHVFIWDRKTSKLLNILEGDGEVVNVVQGHPYEPTMAVSGIDHSIKIFSADKHEQYNARKGLGVRAVDPGLSSLEFGRRRRGRSYRASNTELDDDERPESSHTHDAANSSDEDDMVAPNGLSSRKRMLHEYEITSRNDMDRKGGREDAFITRALLAQLAQRIHAHHGEDGDEYVEGAGGGPILVNNEDGCHVQ